MGNGDIRKGLDRTNHSLPSKTKDHGAKPTCTELRAVMLRKHNKLFVCGTIGLTEPSRRRRWEQSWIATVQKIYHLLQTTQLSDQLAVVSCHDHVYYWTCSRGLVVYNFRFDEVYMHGLRLAVHYACPQMIRYIIYGVSVSRGERPIASTFPGKQWLLTMAFRQCSQHLIYHVTIRPASRISPFTLFRFPFLSSYVLFHFPFLVLPVPQMQYRHSATISRTQRSQISKLRLCSLVMARFAYLEYCCSTLQISQTTSLLAVNLLAS